MVVVCVRVLKAPLSTEQGIWPIQRRAMTLGGLLGLAYVGLRLYRAFGVFRSTPAVNAFYFFESLVAGISIAMVVYFFSRKSAKVVLGVSGVLFIGLNLLVIPARALWNFTSATNGFFSLDGLLLGVSTPMAIFLWLSRKDPRGEVN
jgi:hypothetical protein